MGYIVSILVFCLGNIMVWLDYWFIKNIYYLYFLYLMFKIRFYCMYYFFVRYYDRKVIFFSYFEILKYFKNIKVNIYYYDGKWEDEYEDYKWEIYIKYYNLDVNRDLEIRIFFKRFVLLKVFNVVFLIMGIRLLNDINIKYYDRNIFWFFLKLKRYLRFYKNYIREFNKDKILIYKKRLYIFVIFVYLFIFIRKIFRKSFIFFFLNYDIIICRYYYLGVVYKYSKRWVKFMLYVYLYYF